MPPRLSLQAPNSNQHRRKWSRDTLQRQLDLIGTLAAPLPPTLPSPPASRSASPVPSAKRKAAGAASKPNKRPRTDTDRPPPSVPVEDGEVPDDIPPQQPASVSAASAPAPAAAAPSGTAAPTASSPPSLPSTSDVPVKRPKSGKVITRHCDALHDKYHAFGRLLKYSGDARFWSTYPSSHREYRPLANPPAPNSPYYKHGGLIARLELLDALVCFTYSIWNREFCRRTCNRETWRTIEGFLVWCKQKWQAEEGTTEQEKAFLGLIWMIEGFIHVRKLVYATNHGTPLDRDTDKLVTTTRAAVSAAAAEAAASHINGSLAPKSSAAPTMLPSPASLAPSANSTPTNRDGTPSSTAGSTSSAGATHGSGAGMLPSLPSAFLPSEYKHAPVPPHISTAMENVTVPIGPRLVNEFKSEQLGIANASFCMGNSEKYLNLPVMARYFPTTFTRMVMSSLSANEEYEPDFEDEEGELFWPGQSITGEGLGWVCLMGKAMIKEFGKVYSYRGLDGVVPKPKPEEEAAHAPADRQQQHLHSGSTPLSHNSPLPLVR